jgi:hypothetical protein
MVVDRAGNTLRQAASLANLSGTVTRVDRVGDSDRQDIYRFSLSNRSRLNCTLAGLRAKADLYLLNVQGGLLLKGNLQGKSTRWLSQELAVGTYYVRIQTRDRRSTSYRLTLSSSPIDLPTDPSMDNSTDNATDSGNDALAYQRYTFTYNYGNGDYYTGYGYAAKGTYVNNQILQDSNLNGTDQLGFYTINQVTTYSGTTADLNQVWVDRYYDQESGQTRIPDSGVGRNGLGTETGYLIAGDTLTYFGDRQFAANIPVRQYTFTYYYAGSNDGTSDSYSGSVYAYDSTYIPYDFYDYSSNANETGKNGKYYINGMITAGAIADLGKVQINSYWNSENNTTYTPYFTQGNNYLGSESGYLTSAQTDTNDRFGNDFYEADIPFSGITVTSPSTDIHLTSGSNTTITWNSNISDNVRIDLYKGTTYYSTIDSSTVNDGSENWLIPSTLPDGSDYTIRISSTTNTALYDESDTPFTISSTPSNSFDIKFDYRFDTNGWFTPAKKAALEAAASIWEKIILDEFNDVPIGTSIQATNPQTGNSSIFTSDTAIDDLLIFVGARDLGTGGTLGLGGPSATWIVGSDLDTRYNGNDFSPWTGSITFNSNATTNWFFDSTPSTANDIPFNSTDFISVAIHEIGHVLGIGTAPAYDNLVVNGTFVGSNALAHNDGVPVPLAYDAGSNSYAHIQSGYPANHEAVMDPELANGVRRLPTALDAALLDDIGYDINYAAIP